MVKDKDMQFCLENLKKKRKRKFFFDFLERGFKPQIFSNFPAHDLMRSNLGEEVKISRL